MKNQLKSLLVMAASLILIAATISNKDHQQNFASNSPGLDSIVFVDNTALGMNDGSSWTDAYLDLQDALQAARDCDTIKQVWVAAGVYYTIQGQIQSSATFNIPSGLKVFGGFAGGENPETFDLDNRDFVTNETILTGEQFQVVGFPFANALHVVRFTNVSSETQLNGFTIRDGDARGADLGQDISWGGGILNIATGVGNESSPRVRHCRIISNEATFGGGVYTRGLQGGNAFPVFEDCEISDNSINVLLGNGAGGGIAIVSALNSESSPTFIRCSINANAALFGGGIYNDINTIVSNGSPAMGYPRFIECDISENTAANIAGAILNEAQNNGISRMTLERCTITGNSTLFSSSGAIRSSGSGTVRLTLRHTVVSGNLGDTYAGGISILAFGFNGQSTLDLINSNIIGNRAVNGIGGLNVGFLNGGTGTRILNMVNSVIWDNQDASGVGTPGANMDIANADIVNIDNSLIQGYNPAGSGNLDGTDPMNAPSFSQTVDPGLAPTTIGDFNLVACGNLIDRGTVSILINTDSLDLDGEPRIQRDSVDIGAHEFSTLNSKGTIVYVDSSATGANSGGSWANAFTDLQDAIYLASICPDARTIWVAKGTYFPTDGVDRDSTFQIQDSVCVFGGFAGNEDPVTFDLDDRDFVANETILSGNIGDPGLATDNSRHVVRTSGVSEETTVDGFTITAGHAVGGTTTDQYGGGWLNEGNVGLLRSNPTIRNIRFYANQASFGAALVNLGTGGVSNPHLSYCDFVLNIANLDAGAIWNLGTGGDASPQIRYCRFIGNEGVLNTGAINNTADNGQASPQIINCIFTGNTTSIRGGAILNAAGTNGECSPRIINTTITGNSVTDVGIGDGGGIANFSTMGGIVNPVISNTIIWNNSSANANPNIAENGGSASVITYSLIEGLNPAGDGNLDGTSSSNNPDFFDDVNPLSAPTTAGNVRVKPCSPVINVGTPDSLTVNESEDLDGNTRIVDTNPDLGAYEFQGMATDTILYVDSANAMPGAGGSWASSLTNLQQAIILASACNQINTIWVAKGTYYVTDDGNRDSSFVVPDGLRLIGGFNPAQGASNLSGRDWYTHETILSGEIQQNGNSVDNSFQVVRTTGVSRATVVDGFVIQEGNSNSVSFPTTAGGGWYNDGSGSGNSSSPTILNTTFRNNEGTIGAGMYNYCNNGGLVNPLIDRCRFIGNNATAGAGAIFLPGFFGTAQGEIKNTLFSGNRSVNLGGAVYCLSVSGTCQPLFENCTFSGNFSGNGGAVAMNQNSGTCVVEFTNSIIWGNDATTNPNLSGQGGADSIFNYSVIQGINPDGDGNLDGTITSDPLFVDPVDPNSAPSTLGDFRLLSCSPAINAGTNDSLTVSDSLDLDLNNRRFAISTVDMGAYEFQGSRFTDTILYVRFDAIGANDGSSWFDAYTDLQDALSFARGCPFVTTIWVARGTYKPTSGTDRNAHFAMVPGVKIFGGFAGFENPSAYDLNNRNFDFNETILSAEIATSASIDNCYHVILNNNLGLDASACLDGFTITDGYADNNSNPNDGGGGMYNITSAPTVRNCRFIDNYAQAGGGLRFFNANALVENCDFEDNTGVTGSGVLIGNVSIITFRRCNFVNNVTSGFDGGAMFSFNSSRFHLDKCVFRGNSILGGDGEGGGIYASAGSGLSTISNSQFIGNYAQVRGGAIFLNSGTNVLIRHSSFSGNRSDIGTGGAIYCTNNSNASIQNSILWNNSPNEVSLVNANPTISRSIVTGGCPVGVACDSIIDKDPLFVDQPATGPSIAGDLHLKICSPAIDVGDNAFGLPDDFDGNLRPFNALNADSVDLGAFEFSSTFTLLCDCGRPDSILYVDKDAMGANTGKSWTDAHTDLQSALDSAAGCSSFTEIWVAEGVYYPTSCAPCMTADRLISFSVPPNVRIYGGFDGSEAMRDERNWNSNLTILSGDIGTPVDSTDNSYRVMTFENSTVANVLDGFIIEEGNADGSTINNTFFNGGGIYIDANPGGTGDLQMSNCTVRNNFAGGGGGIAIDAVLGGTIRARLYNCLFENNRASTGNVSSTGGAIIMLGNSGAQIMPEIVKCTFRNNYVGNDGGAISMTPSGATTVLATKIDSCVFENNESTDRGGAVWYRIIQGTSAVTVKNSRFEDNVAGGQGGGMFARASFGALANDTTTNCIFKNNRSTGTSIVNDGVGGALLLRGSQEATRNHRVINCLFVDNYATDDGGAVATTAFFATPSDTIGTINAELVNCTFFNNRTDGSGGGLHVASEMGTSNIQLQNCIFWQDSAAIEGHEIWETTNAMSITVTNSDVQGGLSAQLNDGGNNLNVYPEFVDTANCDLQLTICSGVLNRGSNTALSPDDVLDLAGNTRVFNGAVDMGAYEFQGNSIDTIIYVDVDAGGINDGSSWTDAFTDLQDALALAESCINAKEIWVAEGVYYPTSCAPCMTADRLISFSVPPNVRIYGGFDGSEAMRDERNWNSNLTILSGDIGTPVDSTDNSYRVMTFENSTVANVLDGFIIEEGNADGSTINNTFFNGGGIYIDANPGGTGDLQMSNCTVRNNFAGGGGGIAIDAVLGGTIRARLYNCLFENNRASTGNVSSTGGAIIMLGNSGAQIMPEIVKCTFRNNYVGNDGGAISMTPSGATTVLATKIDSCVFENNESTDRGGAVWYRIIQGTSAVTVKNSRFEDNVAGGQGGGMFARASFGALANDTTTNCIFKNNRSTGTSIVNDGVGGALLLRGSQEATRNHRVINCLFVDNYATDDGGAVATTAFFATPSDTIGTINAELVNCTFFNNRTDGSGGGLHVASEMGTSNIQLQNCIFWQDSAAIEGHEIWETTNAMSITVTNSDVQGGLSAQLNDGGNNINAYPNFVDTTNCDLTLLSCSQAINAGSNAAIGPSELLDLNGDPRLIDGAVDMGAYEFQGILPLPVASCMTDTIYLDINQMAIVTPDSIDAGSMADCGIDTLYVSVDTFGCDSTGIRSIDLIVVDVLGRADTCTTQVVILGTDDDGDGYFEECDDCNDNDPNINPGAPEVCGDGIDNNCDNISDDVSSSGYCCVTGTNSNAYIDQVTLSYPIGNIVRLEQSGSDNDGYGDYTDPPGNITTGIVPFVYFNITPGLNRQSYIRIWVDWNQNGNFDPFEMMVQQITNTVWNGQISVPFMLRNVPGEYTVRIGLSQRGYIDEPCDEATRGEFEDYVICIANGCPQAPPIQLPMSDDQLSIGDNPIRNLKSSISIQVRPNPFRDNVLLSATMEDAGLVEVRMIDQQGNIVLVHDFEGANGVDQVELTTQHLAAGLYYVQVISGDKYEVLKVIKE